MGSGINAMVINSRELAVSNDINRLQQFLAQGQAEVLRWLMNVSQGDSDVNASQVLVQNVVQAAPESAEILNGLCVRPQVGSTSTYIDPGAVNMIDPDGATSLLPAGTNSPDDSIYKLVTDLGIQTPGALVLLPNTSGSTRIDIVECSRNAGGITSTENRNIFNTSTGLFSATSVTKTTKDSLSYRIRTGTPGAGFPGTAQGWLPLAVASVPTGTSVWDTVTVWDVRPLVSDRVGIASSYAVNPKVRGHLDATTYPNIVGTMDVVFQGRKIGGQLLRGSPGTDHAYFDQSDTANCSPSFSITANDNSLYTLYLVVPFGLPRWARYTDYGTGYRNPRSPCGIPILSSVLPNSNGVAATNIYLPLALGFGAASDPNAVAVVTNMKKSAAPTFTMVGDHVKWTDDAPGSTYTSGNTLLAGTATGLAYVAFAVTAGTWFPASASEVDLHFGMSYTVGTTQNQTMTNKSSAGPATSAPALCIQSSGESFIPVVATYHTVVDCVMKGVSTANNGAATQNVTATAYGFGASNGSTTLDLTGLQVTGYRIF